MDYKSKLKSRIKKLIPEHNGKAELAQSVEVFMKVYSYFYKTNIAQKVVITRAEKINGRFYVSDGFNDFSISELSQNDAILILEQL